MASFFGRRKPKKQCPSASPFKHLIFQSFRLYENEIQLSLPFFIFTLALLGKILYNEIATLDDGQASTKIK